MASVSADSTLQREDLVKLLHSIAEASAQAHQLNERGLVTLAAFSGHNSNLSHLKQAFEDFSSTHRALKEGYSAANIERYAKRFEELTAMAEAEAQRIQQVREQTMGNRRVAGFNNFR
jgi:hypothetical protein